MNELQAVVAVVATEAARRRLNDVQTFVLATAVMEAIDNRALDDDAMDELMDTCSDQADEVIADVPDVELSAIVDAAVAAAKACTT